MNTTHPQKFSSVPAAIVFGLIAAFIWGVWPAVSAFGINQSLSAMDLTALRLGVAGVILLPLFWKLRLGFFGFGDLSWQAAVLIVSGAGLPYVLFATGGLEFAPAGHFGVITPSTQLTASTIGSWLILKEKPSRIRLIAIIIILSGVALTGWEGLQGRGEGTWIGDLMYVAAGVLWAMFTVSARYYSVNSFHAAALVSVWSMVLYLPFYFLFFGSSLFEASVTEIVAHGFFQGFLTAVVAIIVYTRAITIIGVGRAAVFPTLVPGITVLLAIPILGEYPTMLEMTGLLIVSFGMLMAFGLLDRFISRH